MQGLWYFTVSTRVHGKECCHGSGQATKFKYFPPTGVHRNGYLVNVNLRLEIRNPFILLGQHGFIGSDGATQPCYQVQKLHVGLLKVRLTSGQNTTQSSLGIVENSGGEAIESSWVQLVTPVSTFY